MRVSGAAGSIAAAALCCAGSFADIDPNSGIDFVRITHPGNAPWPGRANPTPGEPSGRGSVGYEYNIGKFEVTTAQWVEFFNAAFDRPNGAGSERIPFVVVPGTWAVTGAATSNPGGARWQVRTGGNMLPVGDITWRTAAIYCNWLHNGKATNREAFLSGAYDVSTFGNIFSAFTDQATHSPSARYWIPTWDEWLKAAHYDPNKNGPGQPGWWNYSTTSDTAPISNPPPSMLPGSNGQVNAGGWTNIPDTFGPFSIPLGAYSNVTSPWGLYDVAGGTSEWTEEVVSIAGFQRGRKDEGSWWLDGNVVSDSVWGASSDMPHISTFDHGLRIAAAVPAPAVGTILAIGMAGVVFGRKQRRVFHETEFSQGGIERRGVCPIRDHVLRSSSERDHDRT